MSSHVGHDTKAASTVGKGALKRCMCGERKANNVSVGGASQHEAMMLTFCSGVCIDVNLRATLILAREKHQRLLQPITHPERARSVEPLQTVFTLVLAITRFRFVALGRVCTTGPAGSSRVDTLREGRGWRTIVAAGRRSLRRAFGAIGPRDCRCSCNVWQGRILTRLAGRGVRVRREFMRR